MSQYLPCPPESDPAQATGEQPDKPINGQGTNSEVFSPPAMDAHTTTGDIFQASPQQLAEWLQTNSTLWKMRELVCGGWHAKGRAQFLQKNSLLYTTCSPDGGSELVNACEQLVLSKQCRSTVLQTAHDVPASGHPGINKTTCRVLSQFYWPGVFKDVADHCRQCEVCQRSPGRQDRVRTKMIPMPLIEKPFQRIAMGIMGPLMKKPIWQQIYPDHLTVPHGTQRPYRYPVLKPRESPRNW